MLLELLLQDERAEGVLEGKREGILELLSDLDTVPEDLENDARFSYISDPTDRLVLEAALKALGDEERQIVLLHAVSGLKHREIAADLGLPLSTVLSRYNRSLKKLQRFLTEEGVRL